MNLHAKVRPPRLRHQILADRLLRQDGNRLMAVGHQIVSRATYQTFPDGRIDFTRIPTWTQIISPYPCEFYSTNTRARPWICPLGYTHRRYWTIRTAAAYRDIDEYHAACEHTSTLHPVTGLPC